MTESSADEILDAASGVLPKQEACLLGLLVAFTDQRLVAAADDREEWLLLLRTGGTVQASVHSFLRECWEALDGLAREANVCMHRLFPQAGLFPPMEMTRQCTFYVVRKKLHEHPETADHPVSRILWERTRGRPAGAYVRLSFLYNLSLFVPVDVVGEGLLPGSEDVPASVRAIVRTPPGGAVQRCRVGVATTEIMDWLWEMVDETRGRLMAALTGE